jgi:hypothetical protein
MLGKQKTASTDTCIRVLRPLGRLYLIAQSKVVDCSMMLVARTVALRVNGVLMKQARVRPGRRSWRVIITDPILGEFALNDRFTLELLDLLHPNEVRQRLPNGGWRKVSLWIFIALLRSGAVRVVQEGAQVSKDNN